MKKKDIISDRLEAEVVKAINDLCDSNQREALFTESFLKEKFPEEDPKRLIAFLEARGLISYRSSGLDNIRTYRRLDKCITYFEDKARQEAEKRADRTHDWLIAVFSALAGAFLSRPLWEILENIWAKFVP